MGEGSVQFKKILVKFFLETNAKPLIQISGIKQVVANASKIEKIFTRKYFWYMAKFQKIPSADMRNKMNNYLIMKIKPTDCMQCCLIPIEKGLCVQTRHP